MVRITFEILPGGDAKRASVIGIMEVANIATRLDGTADYAVALKKTPPFAGALQEAWRQGFVTFDDVAINGVLASEDDDLITAFVGGQHRSTRGVYDLLYRALVACGLHKRAQA